MSSIFNLILLQGQGGAGILVNLMPILLIFVIFYFLMIVPQRKQQRRVQDMLDNLKIGDKVVFGGGIYGTVTIVREDKRTVQVRVADNPSVKIDVARSAISGLQDTGEEKK
jgi:preprotein translocase subunit YajC